MNTRLSKTQAVGQFWSEIEILITREGKEVDIVANKKLPIPNQRILVKFEPQKDEIKFIGQFKPHNKEWVDFCEESYSTEIDLDKIQELLYRNILYHKINHHCPSEVLYDSLLYCSP